MHQEVTNNIRMFIFLNGGKELVKHRHFLLRMSNFHKNRSIFWHSMSGEGRPLLPSRAFRSLCHHSLTFLALTPFYQTLV